MKNTLALLDALEWNVDALEWNVKGTCCPGMIREATIIPPHRRRTRISNLTRHPLAEEANQLYFDVQAHLGVDSQTKVILAASPANVARFDVLAGPLVFLWECARRSMKPVMDERRPRSGLRSEAEQ